MHEQQLRYEYNKRQKRLARLANEPRPHQQNRERFHAHILKNIDKVSPSKPNFKDLCADFGLSGVHEGERIYYEVMHRLMHASATQEKMKGERGNV